MRYLEKEISCGRGLEENIPDYVRGMLHIYRRYSFTRLSMNYFTFYEMAGETKVSDKKLLALTDTLNTAVGGIVNSGADFDAAGLIARTDEARREVISVMKGLTAWVDIFNIYEYCFNRAEYRFAEPAPEISSDEELARDILKYIVNDKDQAAVNSRICECVRQLPIRMTKNRFFELLREGLSVYKDSEKGSVDDFIYMIRTVALLDIPESTFAVSEEINEIYSSFREIHFKELDKETYKKCVDKLTFAVDYIRTQVDYYMMLEENLNDVYVLLLTSDTYLKQAFPSLFTDCEKKTALLKDTKDEENCVKLLQKETKLFLGESYEELCGEIEDGFLFLEGKQEKYADLSQKYGYLLETVYKQETVLEKLGAGELDKLFEKIELLASGSLFVDFADYEEKKDSEKRQTAGLSYVSGKADRLKEELQEQFKSQEKTLNRAVMAHVLSELPIFFHDMEEVKDYVYQSLSGCQDVAEKAAVAEIFRQMAEEDLMFST